MGIANFGAFSLQAAQLIQQAIAQAGFGTTGNIYYCDPVNGLDTNNGTLAVATTPGQGPVQSLSVGYAQLRSGYNDVLVLIGNGTANGSARITTFTWSKNAAHLFGVCAPSSVSQRARIAFPTTSGLTVTANFFIVSGNGCLFQNVSWFVGAGSGQTGIAASICMTLSGSRCVFINCDIEGMGDTTASVSTTSRNLLITGGGEHRFAHCNIGLDTIARTGANASVEFKAATVRNIFEDCTFLFLSTDGNQYGLLAAAANALDRFVLFNRCIFLNATLSGGTALTYLVKSAAGPGGYFILKDCGSVGFTVIAGSDTNSKAATLLIGPAPSAGAMLAVAPTN